MTIEEAIYGLLTADLAVRGLIASRLFPDQAPEGTEFPCVVYSQADQRTVMTYGGPKKLNSYSMSFEVFGTSKRSVKDVSRAIRSRLNGYRGVASGMSIQGIFDESETSGVEIPIHADEFGVYSAELTFFIWYRADAVSPNATTTATS